MESRLQVTRLDVQLAAMGSDEAAMKHAQIGKMSLTWKELTYSIQDKKSPDGRKRILHPQAGQALPGDLIALIGPSGSGKTSLLNSLAGRLPITKGASFTGSIEVNGLPVGELPCPFADVSAYVEQEDAMFALNTVQETLDFSARLRLPSHFPAAEREARIEEVLRQLGLLKSRHTNVGGTSFNGAIRGLSGGERKRLSIAIELLHQPTCIFLDEPTTGLDSYQALNVMEKMSGLAKDGHTVLVSIHQPRSSIYAMFSGIYLLAAGKPVYAGAADEAIAYFASLGHQLPSNFNPADFLIDLVSVDQRDPEEQARTEQRLTSLQEQWHQRGTAKSLTSPEFESKTDRVSSVLAARSERPAGQHSLLAPFLLLLRRGWREQMRDSFSIMMKTIFMAFFAVLFGLVYFQLDMDQQSIQDRTGILMFLTMNQAFGSVIDTAQVIPRQLSVVQRERACRLYAVFPFYLSNLIVSLPIQAIPILANNVVVFYMADLSGSFWIFFAILFLENLAGISLGMALSACCQSVTMAPQLAPAVVILFLVFNGFMINEESIPDYFVWLKEISFIRYAFKGAAVNEFEGSRFACSADPDAPCIEHGDQYLERLGFDGEGIILSSLVILLVIGAAFNFLAYMILVYRRPRFLQLEATAVAAPAAQTASKLSDEPEAAAPPPAAMTV